MTDQELKRLMNSLQNSIGSFTNAVDNARNQMDRAAANSANAEAREDKEFEERLKKLAKWNKAEDAERMEEIRRHRAHLKSLQEAEQRQRDQIAEHIKKSQEHERKMDDLRNERVKALAALKAAERSGDAKAAAVAKKKADEQLVQINTLRKAKNAERDAAHALTKKLTTDLAEAAKIQQTVTAHILRAEKELSRFSWKDMGRKVGSDIGGELKQGVRTMFSGLTITNALVGAFGNLTDVMATGGDNVLASLDKQADLIKLGLTPDDYIKMNAASRQTILATGGVSQQMNILSQQSQELRGHFKTVGDATKFTQGQMDLFARSGIKPTINNAGLLNESFKKMKAYTGMTGDAFLQMQQELATDADIQSQLRSANMQEREQILASNAARMAEQVAMGMTAEQAKNVTKSLAKMANTGPLDRIKQAAKMRALGAAMGVEGADDAANIHLKGKRATPEERKRLEEWNSSMSNRMSEAQMGSFGGEIVADRLQNKLGNEFTGPDSVFNTRLAEGNKISEGALAQQVKVNENLEKIISKIQQFGAAKENPYIQGAGGVMGSVGNAVGSGVGSTIGSWFGTKMGLGGVTMPTTVPPAAAGGAPSGGKVGNFLRGPGGKLLGRAGAVGAVGVAGYEAYDAASEYDEGKITEAQRNERYGKAGGGLAGALAGMKLGAMGGGALGAGFAGVGAVPGALLGGLGGAALGAWGGSELFGGLGGLFGSDETKMEKEALDQKKKLAIFNAKMSAKMVAPADGGTSGELVADRLQTKIDGQKPISPPTISSPLTSADTRAETTSPIGMQLSKMDASNEYLKELTTITAKQLELAEKQLAATVVSKDDQANLFKSLASGNKFMTSYSTLT